MTSPPPGPAPTPPPPSYGFTYAQLPTFGRDPFEIPEGGNRKRGSQTFRGPGQTQLAMQPGNMTFGKAHRYAAGVREWEESRNAAKDAAINEMYDGDSLKNTVASSRGRTLMQVGDDYQTRMQNQSVLRLLAKQEKSKSLEQEDYQDMKTLLTPYIQQANGIDMNALLQMDDATLIENFPALYDMRMTNMYVSDLARGTTMQGGSQGPNGAPMTLLEDVIGSTPEERERYARNSQLIGALTIKARGMLLSQLQRETEEVAPGSGPNLNPIYFTEVEADRGWDEHTNDFIDKQLRGGNLGLLTALQEMRGPNSHYNVRGNR